MNTLHHNQNQLNTQIPYSSPLRGQPISADEWADTVQALMQIGGGYEWKSSRVVASGKCWNCHTDAEIIVSETTGRRYCGNCGVER